MLEGTQVSTPNGEAAVETLRTGDIVLTRDNGPQPIRWIGATRRMAIGHRAPIRFAKGAIGNVRELWLAPLHRVMIEGWPAELLFGEKEVLAPSIGFVDGRKIRRVPDNEVTYFDMLFDSHQVIFLDDAPCESFCLCDATWRDLQMNALSEIRGLFPGTATNGRDLMTLLTGRCLTRREAVALQHYLFRDRDRAQLHRMAVRYHLQHFDHTGQPEHPGRGREIVRNAATDDISPQVQ